MTLTEEKRLDTLLKIAEERNTPLSDWEVDFVQSLDARRKIELSDKQLKVFERLVEKHLC